MLNEQSFPKTLFLRAGPLELVFEPGNMFVRYVRVGSHELVRGIYAAVRDADWGTYVPQLEELETEIGNDSFVVRWLSTTPVLQWIGELTGTARGSITYEVRGSVDESYLTGRTGICVLHPAKECAGRQCRIEHADGHCEDSSFPFDIAPHQPFFGIRAMEYGGPGDSGVRLEFSGDVFETEDQRNWTDASFKTYCRPLALPYPYRIEEGQLIEQSVSVTFRPQGFKAPVPLRSFSTLESDVSGSLPLPKLGTMLACGTKLEKWQVERLLSMRFDHIGVSVDLKLPDWGDRIQATADLGLPFEFHVRSFDLDESSWTRFLSCIKGRSIARILLVSDDLQRNYIRFASSAGDTLGTSVPLFATSAENFTELNRNRPVTVGLTGVGFALNPQVHAFDDLSLMESTEMHGETVRNARRIFGGSPVVVSPITLEPRKWASRKPDERLRTPFGVAWTLASLNSLASAGAHAATYFESHGPRGILGEKPDEPGPLEQLFADVLMRKAAEDCAAVSDMWQEGQKFDLAASEWWAMPIGGTPRCG